MIDWRHPRIYAQLRCSGLVLFTLGMASRNIDNPIIATAALALTAMLLYRLKIEHRDLKSRRGQKARGKTSTYRADQQVDDDPHHRRGGGIHPESSHGLEGRLAKYVEER